MQVRHGHFFSRRMFQGCKSRGLFTGLKMQSLQFLFKWSCQARVSRSLQEGAASSSCSTCHRAGPLLRRKTVRLCFPFLVQNPRPTRFSRAEGAITTDLHTLSLLPTDFGSFAGAIVGLCWVSTPDPSRVPYGWRFCISDTSDVVEKTASAACPTEGGICVRWSSDMPRLEGRAGVEA